MTTRITMAGGTGLVGGLLSARLAQRPDVELDSLVRVPRYPWERAIDFEKLVSNPRLAGSAPVSIAISCLGTTLAAAGSPDAFRRVDRDYVVAFAQAARSRGATRFILVSSVGAGGRGLYLATKGQTEAALRGLGFERLDLLRPSLLLGPRADRRPVEAMAQMMAPLVNRLLRGPVTRYAALDAGTVAAAIETLSMAAEQGVHVHHVAEISALATYTSGFAEGRGQALPEQTRAPARSG